MRRLVLAGFAVVLAALALDALLLGSFAFVEIAPALVAYRAPGEAIAAWNERAAREPEPGPRRAEGLTLVILDGLRLDVSRDLRALGALRARGRDAWVRAPFPSFTRVGYGAILTGAPPLVHGYVSNAFQHPAPVVSIAERARGAGIRTRFIGAGGASSSWIPRMFPNGFDEVLWIGPALEYPRPPAGTPYLDVVYVPDPDDAGHRHGGASEPYRAAARAVDRALGALVARLDLAREALIVTTDHGHLDIGGHGGHEEVVIGVPFVEAGAGTEGSLVRDGDPLEVVPREAARILGVRAPPPPWPELRAPVRALLLAGIDVRLPYAIAFVAAAVFLVRLGDRRAALGALLAVAIFVGFYAARGRPFSFSIINDPGHIPLFALEVVILGNLALLAVRALGARPALLPAALAVAVAWVALAGAVAGPSAPTAIHVPRAAYIYQLALGYAVAIGVACAAGGLIARARGRRRTTAVPDV